MKAVNDINSILALICAVSFIVNIIVQLTKGYIKLPTKLWCIAVAFMVDISLLLIGAHLGLCRLSIAAGLFSFLSSFVIAFIAMYGFDSFKDLWLRFKAGENINGNN